MIVKTGSFDQAMELCPLTLARAAPPGQCLQNGLRQIELSSPSPADTMSALFKAMSRTLHCRGTKGGSWSQHVLGEKVQVREREREHVFHRGGVRLGSGGVIELLSLSFSVAIAKLDSLLINKEGSTYFYVSLHPANLSIFT